MRGHIRWEERELFERLQADLDDAELDAAGAEIAERIPKPERVPWEAGS